MKTSRHVLCIAVIAAALTACKNREERVPNAQSDTTPSTASSDSQRVGTGSSGTTAPSTTAVGGAGPSSTQAATGGSTTGEAGAPVANHTAPAPGAASPGAAATAPLAPADQQFLAKAAEGSQYEVEIAKLALEKASDPAVKAFAQMLVTDHGAAGDKLRQIASGHNVALPGALPEDKQRELQQLGQLSGAAFDREFVKRVGIRDHQHDIAEFEKASQGAQAPDVKSFALGTLPTLKKHLASAQKLPGAAKG